MRKTLQFMNSKPLTVFIRAANGLSVQVKVLSSERHTVYSRELISRKVVAIFWYLTHICTFFLCFFNVHLQFVTHATEQEADYEQEKHL